MSEADHDASLWMEDDQAEDRCHLLAPHEPHPWGEVDVTTLPNWCVGVLAERAPGFRCARGDHTYHGWGPCPAPAVPVGVQPASEAATSATDRAVPTRPEPAEEACEWPECGFRCAETSQCAPAVPVVHPEPQKETAMPKTAHTPSPTQQRRDRWQEAYIAARRDGSGIFTLIQLADQEQADLREEVARLHAELADAEEGQ